MSNTPKLRFPEFSGEWEEKKFDELSQVNPKPDALPAVFTYIDLESVKNGVLLQDKMIKKEDAPSRAQRLLKDKDILFQTVRPYQRNNYFFNSKTPSVASTGYAQFRVNKNNYPSFLYQYLYTDNFVKNVLDRCSGTSFPAISTNDLLEISIYMPSLAEQQKIADFLSNVDSIITAETKILNTLQKKKKALMQKLFTQQLRFKSNNGTVFPEWEEKLLGDICEVTKLAGFEFTEYVKYKDTGNIIALRGLNVKECRLVLDDVKYIDDSNLDKLSRSKLYRNDILFTYIGTVGQVAIIQEDNKYYLAPNVSRLRIKNNNSISKFLMYQLSDSRFYKKRIYPLIASSSQPALSMENIRLFKIQVPSKSEQQKITDCLSSMDSLIQTQQKVVTTWQQRKKALLQQMFI